MFTLKSNMEARIILSGLNHKLHNSPCHPHKLTRLLRNSIRDYLEEQDHQARQDKNRKLWRAEQARKSRKVICCPPCCRVNDCEERR